ncbi:hypothetical protein Tco_0375337 [Tanacetum coccineum]
MMSFLIKMSVIFAIPLQQPAEGIPSNLRKHICFNDGRVDLTQSQGRGKFFLLWVQVGPTLQEQVGSKFWETIKAVMFTTAKGKGHIIAFLAVQGTTDGQATMTVITYNAYLIKPDDLIAYDSDCDEFSTAKVALMANLSHYGLDALAEVHNPDKMDNNMINQGVQVMSSSEQSNVQAAVQNCNSSAQQDALILSVIEQLKT